MKTLGIIGGVGPESTIEYYRTIIELYRERVGDGSYPQLVINSIDLKREIELVERNDLAELTRFMRAEVEKLARVGVDFGLIASNTPHIVFEEMEKRSPVPLLSIVETACAEVKARGLKRVGLFGTRFTMQGNFYPKVFSREGIELVRPDGRDQEYIHDKYMNELVRGNFLRETKEGLLRIIDRLRSEKGIESVLLAGTELPLILREPAYDGVALIDTMRVHVVAAVREMFS